MQQFTDTDKAINWLKDKENRVLVITSNWNDYCKDYFDNDFLPFSKTKIKYEFARIECTDFVDEVPYHNYENRYIIGLSAPPSDEYLNNLLSD